MFNKKSIAMSSSNVFNYPDKDLPFAIAFSAIDGVYAFHTQLLIKYFLSLNAAWNASREDLRKAGIAPKLSEWIVQKRTTIEPLKIIEIIDREGISVILESDEMYPCSLKELPDRPHLLYYRGCLPDFSVKNVLAVVGSRKASSYGRAVCSSLLPDIVKAGVEVVSGLAYGIDSLAHTHTLDAGGITYAIIASGLNRESCYPQAHWNLVCRIIDSGGFIMSEYPPGTPALPIHFPRRNRIIAGLASVILIIEADERSGTLITARLGLEYNKEVAAVPGAITHPLSRGTNALLKQGAAVIRNTDDVLDLFSLPNPLKMTRTLPEDISHSESLILSVLSESMLHIDEVSVRTHLVLSELSSDLLSLELKGLVKNCGNMYYVRIRNT